MKTRLIERDGTRGRGERLGRRLRRAGEQVAAALVAGLASLAAPPREEPRYAYLPVLATSRRHPRRRA